MVSTIMLKMIFLNWLLFCIIGLHVCKLCDCQLDKYSIRSRLATKTAYRFLNDTRLKQLGSNGELQGCSVDGLAMILRHGSRNPGKSNINKFSNLYAKLLAVMPQSKMSSALKQWKNPFPNESANELLETGKVEHEDMAFAVKKLYASPITTTDTTFLSSNVTRAIESGQAFMKGLFGSSSAVSIKINDPLVRFYEYCPRYTKEVDENPSASIEYENFKKSALFNERTEQFTNRFALSESITSDELENVFYLCAHEIAANLTQNWSPWCDLLDEADMPIINYGADLNEYYSSGYGYSLNYLSSCPLVRHVVNELSNKAQKHSFIFGHSQTVLPVLSILGFFNDSVKLTANTFKDGWLFQMQTIGVFATNVLFMNYKCQDESDPAIVVYVNGNPIPWSNGKVKMPLTQLNKMVLNICGVSEDEDKKRCANSSNKIASHVITLFSLISIALFHSNQKL